MTVRILLENFQSKVGLSFKRAFWHVVVPLYLITLAPVLVAAIQEFIRLSRG